MAEDAVSQKEEKKKVIILVDLRLDARNLHPLKAYNMVQ